MFKYLRNCQTVFQRCLHTALNSHQFFHILIDTYYCLFYYSRSSLYKWHLTVVLICISLNGIPLQYSCLGIPKDRGAWWTTVHGVRKSQTWLKNWATTIIAISANSYNWVVSNLVSVRLTMCHIFLFLHMFNNLLLCSVYVCSVAQSCLTLCDPLDCHLPGSSVSMEFFRQEYWCGLPFPTPGDLSDPGIRLASLVSPALAGGFLTTAPPIIQ